MSLTFEILGVKYAHDINYASCKNITYIYNMNELICKLSVTVILTLNNRPITIMRLYSKLLII